MSSDSQRPLTNGHVASKSGARKNLQELSDELKAAIYKAEFHGDMMLGDPQVAVTSVWNDIHSIFSRKNAGKVGELISKLATGHGVDYVAGSQLIGSLPENGPLRTKFVQSQVTNKYERMLHPPLTYLGDAFQYRAADGKFNSVLHPHLGQAGAPYAKTVPSKTHLLGAQPDPGDIFDRLMARDEKRESASGLSSMLIYHATIIIHDIFRTNDKDKNISDSSSYLDLSPLYGYTEEMQRKVRDDKYKLGLLKPDTFAEDRLLRQPPGVCIMLVMYNRYHNYAATQLRRINENGRFHVPAKYSNDKILAVAEQCVPAFKTDKDFRKYLKEYKNAWRQYRKNNVKLPGSYAEERLQQKIDGAVKDDATKDAIETFQAAYDAAWNKLDDDLFNTARLITCGMYVNISIHDYLRALMGFHQYNTTFTLDPRIAIDESNKKDAVSRGIGNQVTVEFNLLYRFHCAISLKDEEYTNDFIRETYGKYVSKDPMNWDPKTMTLNQFFGAVGGLAADTAEVSPQEPWEKEFGLPQGIPQREELHFSRNPITGLFDDQQMVDQLVKSMDDPISNFGPRNVPKSLKAVEILGILQARKWEVGTLNDFRDFFGMSRHKTFADITKNEDTQDALRDLYDHPDKVELYPGIFCEGDENNGLDPGPNETNTALWTAIFSDAITLVRSDRFYTVDWNTNSLTSWGMKEVTPDSDVLKGSVFHRLIQRAFPEWFPYDSVRFFHPFYTAKQNAIYAREQGYEPDFKIKTEIVRENWKESTVEYDVSGSSPEKPVKPVYLSDYDSVKAVLRGDPNTFVNPASFDSGLPDKAKAILTPGHLQKQLMADNDTPWAEDEVILNYFTALTREIVKREIITVDKRAPIYQIDVTRDLAIPVITRYVADFLGFSHRLKSVKHPRREFSENEIYEHITNCQVFLAYNIDETKMLKRRAAFKTSMKFLYELALNGNVKEANQFLITRMVTGCFKAWDAHTAKPMNSAGKMVAQRVLENERDVGRAAAVLLLTALDGAYNSVLAFSSVLNYFMDDLSNYAEAQGTGTASESTTCDWLKVQQLALQDSPEGDKRIQSLVLEAQRLSVKLPVVRTVAQDTKLEINGQTHSYTKGQTIVCDVFSASSNKSNFKTPHDYLTYGSSLSEGFVHFNARKTAILGLTAMIKVLAQMKNLRRGHDTQGQLKRIFLDETNEGYANFMAPMRMEQVRRDVLAAHNEHTTTTASNNNNNNNNIFDERVLKPKTDTYLTPEWDEMIPFPTTWKVRFDGYGPSAYTWENLYKPRIPDDPLYQPQGASHFGGTFAETVCICHAAGVACKCKGRDEKAENSVRQTVKAAEPAVGVKVGGCGMPGP